MFDEKFDEAYDISVKENDLPHVKWGRIDYIDVTALTTKWGVWQYVFHASRVSHESYCDSLQGTETCCSGRSRQVPPVPQPE